MSVSMSVSVSVSVSVLFLYVHLYTYIHKYIHTCIYKYIHAVVGVCEREPHPEAGLVIIYFFRLPNCTLPFEFSGEIVLLCMRESENPILRLRSR